MKSFFFQKVTPRERFFSFKSLINNKSGLLKVSYISINNISAAILRDRLFVEIKSVLSSWKEENFKIILVNNSVISVTLRRNRKYPRAKKQAVEILI